MQQFNAAKLVAIVTVAGILWQNPAQAQSAKYHIAGISCVPSSQTIDAQTHVTQAGNVRFDTGKVGIVTMFCPIPFEASFKAEVVGLTVLLRDGDGLGANVVSVNLRRLQRSNGSISNHQNAQLNSNRDCSEPNDVNWKECAIRFPDDLDFKRFYYFFQVTLRRSNPSVNASFGGIRLSGTVD